MESTRGRSDRGLPMISTLKLCSTLNNCLQILEYVEYLRMLPSYPDDTVIENVGTMHELLIYLLSI